MTMALAVPQPPTPQRMFTATADATVVNTGLETSLVGSGAGALVIPANSVQAGSIFRLTAGGTGTSTAAGGLQLNFRPKIGSVLIHDFSPASIPAGFTWRISSIMTVRANGGSGSARGLCSLLFSSVVLEEDDGNKTVDFTTSQTIDLRCLWSTANASNSITCSTLLLERIA